MNFVVWNTKKEHTNWFNSGFMPQQLHDFWREFTSQPVSPQLLSKLLSTRWLHTSRLIVFSEKNNKANQEPKEQKKSSFFKTMFTFPEGTNFENVPPFLTFLGQKREEHGRMPGMSEHWK